jgi:hypothetical protein
MNASWLLGSFQLRDVVYLIGLGFGIEIERKPTRHGCPEYQGNRIIGRYIVCSAYVGLDSPHEEEQRRAINQQHPPLTLEDRLIELTGLTFWKVWHYVTSTNTGSGGN